MKFHGFTLLELLVTLTILSIILAIGIPGLNQQINKSRTKTAMLTLLDAIGTTRSAAVFRNTRTTLLANNNKWEDGWVFFVDTDNDGLPGNDESLLSTEGKLKGVKITATAPMDSYVSFIGTGEGRRPGQANGGAFITGTIKICPEQPGEGYSLILSRGGRTRVDNLSQIDCEQM
jgi:type IV fimbrial biogenesis protein FimT